MKELTEQHLLEIYDLVFTSAHSDGFKKAEIKDLLFENDYRFIECPKDDWTTSLKVYLESIGYDRSLLNMNPIYNS